MYDVAIIGLGPAGATLARLLSQELSIVAIDRKSPSGAGGFRKPCGGLLATDAQKALAKFSLSLPMNVLVDPQIFTVRTLDTGMGLLRHYQRFYMNMDRHKFDQWLMGLIPERVELLFEAAVTRVARADGCYEVDIKRGGRIETIRAKYLVGADGANSIVRRSLFPGRQVRGYVALQEWYQDRNPRPLYSCFFDKHITDCYAWSISKDGHLVVGGAFPAEDCVRRFELLKRKLEADGYVLGEPVRKESCRVLRPRGPFQFETGADGAFLVGEAAAFISPSSLEGISYALDSATALSDVLNKLNWNPNAAYDRSVRGLKLKLILKHLKSLFMYVPLLRFLVMKSGLQSVKIVH